MTERTKTYNFWRYHPTEKLETDYGDINLNPYYTRRFGGLIEGVTVFVYPGGKILCSDSHVSEKIKQKALRETRKIMPLIKHKLNYGNN